MALVCPRIHNSPQQPPMIKSAQLTCKSFYTPDKLISRFSCSTTASCNTMNNEIMISNYQLNYIGHPFTYVYFASTVVLTVMQVSSTTARNG